MTENFELAKPLGDRVLVTIESKEKTIGGIIIPDSVKTGDNKIAVVVSTGDGVYTHSGAKIPMTVKPGDKVLLPMGEMSVQKIKLGEKDYFLCREMDLLMVIR
jgi:co-chaperonin GroES (HSP10)